MKKYNQFFFIFYQFGQSKNGSNCWLISSINFFPNIYFPYLQKSTWSIFLQNQIQTKQFNDIVLLCLSLPFSNVDLNETWLLFFSLSFTKLINRKINKQVLTRQSIKLMNRVKTLKTFFLDQKYIFWRQPTPQG